MTQNNINETFADILKGYCDVNAFEMVDYLAEVVNDGRMRPEKASIFKEELLNAIKNQTLTPSQYKKLTNDDEYDTQEKLQMWLRELYTLVFKEEPPI